MKASKMPKAKPFSPLAHLGVWRRALDFGSCTVSFLLLAAVGTLSGAQAEEIQLCRAKLALLPIVTGPNASDATRESAGQLASYLQKISGVSFEHQAGDGSVGICVGLPGDFEKLPFPVRFKKGPFDRERYLLRSGKENLWLLGATDLAVQHAVWDLLHRFGYRQFFPGETWEVIPKHDSLAIDVDRMDAPDYCARRIWYNWGMWGYNNGPYKDWCVRNRMAKGFDLNSGHSYGTIIAANRKAFDAHPEYGALIGGERKLSKFCVANAALRQLVVDYAKEKIRKQPRLDSISMDPSDGGGWCECAECARIGSPSDRALTLANEVAEAINSLGVGDKYVGMYAYNMHAPPPGVAVHPKVIISVATAFIRGAYSFDQIVEGWQARGASVGIYDYYSVVAWDWNKPRAAKGSRPHDLAASIRKYHRQGARFLDAESGDAWGPYGLGYYVAGRVMWDVDNADNVEAIIEDFLARAFGPARKPMRQFYELITVDRTKRSSADLIGRMYRYLATARRIAVDAPKVIARIDDLILYTRYVELQNAYASRSSDAGKIKLLAFAHRTRKRMMIHSYGIWARLASQNAANSKDHPAITDEAPFSEIEIRNILKSGIENNQPVDMDFKTRNFGEELQPAFTPLGLPDLPSGKLPPVPQDWQNYLVWIDKAPAEIKLKITVKHVWNNRPHLVSLFSPKAVDIEAVDTSDICRPDGKEREVVLRTPYRGLHRILLRDGGDYSYIKWPKGIPVTLPSSMDTQGVKNQFRGAWTLYFYVPKGTKHVAGWASRIANWAPRISGKLVDADGQAVMDFSKAEDGWFKVPVKPGQDGRLWKFVDSQGDRRLVTVPPYFALHPRDLLLPKEVIESDRQE